MSMRVHIRNAHPETEPETGIPICSRFSAYKCENCDNVHVVLRDDNGNPFAGAVLSDEMVIGIVDVFNDKIASFPFRESNMEFNVKRDRYTSDKARRKKGPHHE